MAHRIRSIRPEFWTSESLGALDIGPRLLAVLLISIADDQGRFRAAPAHLASVLFTYSRDRSPRQVDDVSSWLDELSASGFLALYEVSGSLYGWIPKYRKHQKIDKPSPSLLPAPDDVSAKALRTVGERSCGDWKGVEGKGREEEKAPAAHANGNGAPGHEEPPPPQPPAPPPAAPQAQAAAAQDPPPGPKGPDAEPEPEPPAPRGQRKNGKEPTEPEEACRRAIAKGFDDVFKAATGKGFPWNPKERAHVAQIAAACGNDPAIGELVLKAALTDDWLKRNFQPSSISGQVAKLLLRVQRLIPKQAPAAGPRALPELDEASKAEVTYWNEYSALRERQQQERLERKGESPEALQALAAKHEAERVELHKRHGRAEA